MKTENSGRGGSYFKAAPDAPAVLVEGTDQTPDPKLLEAEKQKPKADITDKGGDK